MKRWIRPNAFVVLIASFCVGAATRTLLSSKSAEIAPSFQPAALRFEIETPKSLDELLAEPLFKIDSNASNNAVADAAHTLYRKYDQYLDERVSQLWDKLDVSTPESQSRGEEEIKSEMTLIADAFSQKFDADVMPKLLQTVADDEFAASDDRLANDALDVCLQTLRILRKNDVVANIHERELERLQNAQENRDADATERSFKRLVSVDRFYLGLLTQPFVDAFDLDVQKRGSDELRAPCVEWANKLAEEVKRDPILIQNCDACYAQMIKRVDENLALEYRAKFRDAIPLDAALEAYARIRDREVGVNDVAIYREESFDESLFDIPSDGNKDLYLSRRRQIKRAASEAAFAPVPKAVKDDYLRKANDAMAIIALRLVRYAGYSTHDYRMLEEATFSPETILQLKKEIESAVATPLGHEPADFLAVARAVVLKYDLNVAVESDDGDAALQICEKFADAAEYNDVAARLLAQELERYAQLQSPLAPALIDAAVAKAEVSNGQLSRYTSTLMRLQEDPGTL